MNLLRPDHVTNGLTNGVTEAGGLGRSRSYHGDRHRLRHHGGKTKSVHLTNGVMRDAEQRRNSLPKSLKIVLDSTTPLQLPVLTEPETPESPSSARKVSEEEKRLRQRLQVLLKAMLSLRQTDISLLKQLWSIADSINEYKVNLDECQVSLDGDSYSLQSRASRSLSECLDMTSLSSLNLSNQERCDDSTYGSQKIEDNVFGSHGSFDFDESEATTIPIMHLDPS